MVGLGGAAFGVGRLVQRVRADIRPVPTEVRTAPPASVPTLVASTPAPLGESSRRRRRRPRTRSRRAPGSWCPRSVDRAVQLDLTPSMGVRSDHRRGREAQDVAPGDVLRLDGKAHALLFTCS